jgi:hypothetical protein
VLTQFPAVIGRSGDADVRLHDRRVSRRHCEIYELDGVPAIRDLNSRNGTCVNGIRTTEALLAPNCTISLGSIRIEACSQSTEEGPLDASDELDEIRQGTPTRRKGHTARSSITTAVCRQDGRSRPASPVERMFNWCRRQAIGEHDRPMPTRPGTTDRAARESRGIEEGAQSVGVPQCEPLGLLHSGSIYQSHWN